MSSPWGRVAVAGVYEHPTRYAPDKTAYQIHVESARGALADAGLTLEVVADAGHIAQLEQPERVNALLAAFAERTA